MNMPGLMPLAPVLADADGIIALIIGLITVVGWIANLVSNKNQKGPPVANRPRPPVRPRDDRLQQEINIFMEEAGSQRGKPAQPGPNQGRPAAPAGRAVGGVPRNLPQAKSRPPVAAPAKKPVRRPRPGADMATRQAPVTESLGAGVKQHLNQYMSEKVSQEVQQRLAPRVEEKMDRDLGTPVTTGASARGMPAPPPAIPPARAVRFGEMLRNPATVQQAIIMNLILSPPPGLARSSRR
jgi:hypothetical protein